MALTLFQLCCMGRWSRFTTVMFHNGVQPPSLCVMKPLPFGTGHNCRSQVSPGHPYCHLGKYHCRCIQQIRTTRTQVVHSPRLCLPRYATRLNSKAPLFCSRAGIDSLSLGGASQLTWNQILFYTTPPPASYGQD